MAEQLTESEEIREAVRERYADAAREAADDRLASCGPSGCGCSCASDAAEASLAAALYSDEERETLPVAAKLASLGCGSPTAVAALYEGETVLDLGSGGGIDVLLSARRVGRTGRA